MESSPNGSETTSVFKTQQPQPLKSSSNSSAGFVTAPSSNISASTAVIIDIAPSTADSEESYLDSLDEARTPLLNPQNPMAYEQVEEDYGSDEDYRINRDGFINNAMPPRQRTASRVGTTLEENLESVSTIIKSPTRRRIPRDRYKAVVII